MSQSELINEVKFEKTGPDIRHRHEVAEKSKWGQIMQVLLGIFA